MSVFDKMTWRDLADPTLPLTAYDFDLPSFHHVRQEFPDEHITDIESAVDSAFTKDICRRVSPGTSVALLVGSRGICAIDRIVKRVVNNLIQLGARPFIVPSMGSHGNGIAEVQVSILADYGITEETMGCPVMCNMDTVLVGHTQDGVPCYADKNAAAADLIVPICRVKCHTDFQGTYESGICKMLSIGLGKHKGCSRIHQEEISHFPAVIPSVAQVMLDHLPVGFAVAVIENAHEHIHTLRAVPCERIMEEEPKLLALSKSLMPYIKIPEADVLIVEKIGKDITGAGMDPNITGRKTGGPIAGFRGPLVQRIIVNGITEASHGNAAGIGLADFTTFDVLRQIDLSMTYTNCMASGDPQCVRLPIILKDEETALRAAIATCTGIDRTKVKAVHIQDTLHLTEIEVSDSLLELCKAQEGLTVLD